MPHPFIPLYILLQSLFGEETGIYIADIMPLPVCHNKCISGNSVFKGLAARGKTTVGWFYELILHIIINHKGNIVAAKITLDNVN